jgi:hypothetical protein
MSRLVARILLTILMFPIASLVYLTMAMMMFRQSRGRSQEDLVFAVSGLVTWGFVGLYWWQVWRESTLWTSARIFGTFAAAGFALFCGVIVGFLAEQMIAHGFGFFLGSVTPPLLWLVMSIFVWRETEEERAARIRRSGGETVACPRCGYNLTGLREARCPECGTQFTLDELMAAQAEQRMESVNDRED